VWGRIRLQFGREGGRGEGLTCELEFGRGCKIDVRFAIWYGRWQRMRDGRMGCNSVEKEVDKVVEVRD
jgi:hypothetical protein